MVSIDYMKQTLQSETVEADQNLPKGEGANVAVAKVQGQAQSPGEIIVNIRKGCGYWDVTVHPKGGHFKRAGESTYGTLWKIVSHYDSGVIHEIELSMPDGRRALVQQCYTDLLKNLKPSA